MTARLYTFADHAARVAQSGQAARLPDARQCGVEPGETTSPQPSGDIVIATQPRVAQIATRDATYRKEAGALPPALPPSLVATIAGCPRIRIDGREVFLLGRVGVAFRDAIGWRWAASIGGPSHDIWNLAFVEALDARASTF